jgi:hypothetical protein
MFATHAFNVISLYCLGMEVRRCVEFIGVELATGAELAAPMRRSWRARGVVEREEDGLLRSGMVETLAGGAEGQWRGGSGGECGHRGGADVRRRFVWWVFLMVGGQCEWMSI